MDSQNLPDHESSYGYRPTTWITVAFTTLFIFTTALHFGQALAYRRWMLLPSLVLGGCGEILGWVGRLWSSKNLWLDTPFMIQISCLIIAPTFLSAANFILLGQIIAIVGQQYSIMSARRFGKVFVTSDVLSLLVQAAGGGIASSANTHDGAEMGAKIMLVGIITQFISLTIYSVLGIDFVRRVMFNKPARKILHSSPSSMELNNTPHTNTSSEYYPLKSSNWERTLPVVSGKLKLLGFGLAFSTLLLFIRGIYRIIELTDGWNGPIIQTQAYFNVFDGMMIVLAMFTLNIFHPGWLMPPT